MEIRLNNVVPDPLLEVDHSKSDIWDKEEVKFQEGGFYILKAPSGKGKTTLASIIFGLRNDYKGSVFLNNKNIRGIDSSELQKFRRENISIVFQGLRLFDELTATENIHVKNNLTNHKTHSEIEDMAQELGIYSLLNKKTATLSFGQKQRLAVLRALCQKFNILILDESFSHLDNKNIAKTWKLIEHEAKNNNATVLINTLEIFSLSNKHKTFLL